MRGADLTVVGIAGVEIVIDAVDAALLQLLSLIPREQIFRLYCCLICGTIVVTAAISRSLGPRAEMTMQYVRAFCSAARCAPSSRFSRLSKLYRGISASEIYDCEQ